MADAVGEHNEEFRGIERLTRTEKFTRKLGPEKLRAAASGSMRDQDRILNLAFLVLRRVSDRPVMDAQFREDLARAEFEVTNDVIGFHRRRVLGGAKHADCCNKQSEAKQANHESHYAKISPGVNRLRTTPINGDKCARFICCIEKRWSTTALQNASEIAGFRMAATFRTAAVFCRSWAHAADFFLLLRG